MHRKPCHCNKNNLQNEENCEKFNNDFSNLNKYCILKMAGTTWENCIHGGLKTETVIETTNDTIKNEGIWIK